MLFEKVEILKAIALPTFDGVQLIQLGVSGESLEVRGYHSERKDVIP